MNKLTFNLIHKRNVINFIKNYDLLGLKKYAEDHNLIDDVSFEEIINEIYDVDSSHIFRCFDENGKVIDSPKSVATNFEYYVHRPKLFEALCKYEPTLLDKLPPGYYKFIEYCNSLGNAADSTFLARAMYDYVFEQGGELNTMLVDGELSEEFYDWIFKKHYDRENVINCSKRIQKHYSKFELKFFEVMHSIAYFEELELLFSEIDRKDFEKCVTLKTKTNHDGYKQLYPRLVLNEKTKKLLLTHRDLTDFIDPEIFSDEEAWMKYSSGFCDELESRYIFHLLSKFRNYFENDKDFDVHKYFYLKDGKVLANETLINKILSEGNYLAFYDIVINCCDEESVLNIKLNDENLNLSNIRKIFMTLYSISKDDPDLLGFVQGVLKNLSVDKSILMLDTNKLDRLKEVILILKDKILNANSKELKKFSGKIIFSILSNSEDFDYEQSLKKIEEVFTRNNVPVFAKKYLIFRVLNPSLEQLISKKDMQASPTLLSATEREKYEIVFSDLFRCTLGSNNISVMKYLENIGIGNELYSKIANGTLSVNDLNDSQKEALIEFSRHLLTLYKYSKEGDKSVLTLTGNIEEDLKMLIPLFKPNERYSLPDRIVRMYGYFAGFKSYDQAVNYMKETRERATKRGIELSKKKLVLEEGDMVKGIGGPQYLFDILQNGSLAKEFLGISSSSDLTPLDTDLSLITGNHSSIGSAIHNSPSSGYGPIYFVIKKDKYKMTRTKANTPGEFTTRGPECFKTLRDAHIGVRTGFPSSDIDYIVVNKNDLEDLESVDKENKKMIDSVMFSIALSGIYIPVVDMKTEEVIYTYEQFMEQRKKMSGLSYYGESRYIISDNLYVPVDYKNQELIDDANRKKAAINKAVSESLKANLGLDFHSKLEKDVTPGSVDLIDTGSTSRGTSISKESDFDYIMRVDEKADRRKITTAILSSFGITYEEAEKKGMIIPSGNLRLKNVRVEGIDEPLEIDISFVSKADGVEYTTDMALSERLKAIKEQYPDKYEQVLDNIIYAKKFMKENGCYKPNHAANGQAQGGMGGVGIENWVLQNGGSFYDACVDFYEKATVNGKPMPFEKFKEIYKVFDFGVNFYTGEHDEFVGNNMSKSGYMKMYKAVSNYIEKNKEKYNKSAQVKEPEKKRQPITYIEDEEVLETSMTR